ncbi:YdaU family protein [Stenotrophomonas maltophilia]|uniref:YdaU family protein n=1 Tax=Stenotrophomonas maltophilia TaxID=40324 RepID=UPI001F53BCD6|nr:YdaU family protein [Stenotrophomonas maltophilia]MCI1124792.1 YdaU family protein [Stenotrophomonas maltophilia]
MIYFEHHIGDYAAATAHLSLLEDAIYSRLLRRYYLQEEALPADVKQVARLAGARSQEELEAVQAVLDEFFTLTDTGWHNKRADEEIERYQAKQDKARASAAARWNKDAMPSDSERIANALRTQCEGNALHTPNTNISTSLRSVEKTRKRASAPDCPDDVDPQTWSDWLALRKAKKAPVTETVLDQARRESRKANLTLTKFLQVWCARGSQGLQADWLKPNERGGPHLGPPSPTQPSKTLSAVQRLQSLKSNANDLDPQRDFGRLEPVALLGSGPDPGFGFDRGDCLDVG